MRENDDQFRYYAPLLRRIIILAAVITAVPVILWTITAFVHSYVGQPKVPTFRPLAAAASTEAPGSATAPPETADRQPPASRQTAVPDPAPPMVEARATTTDARDYSPAPKGPLLSEHAADSDASAPRVAAMTLAAPANADPKAASALAAPATTDGAASSTSALAAQQASAPGDQADDALPAAAPLTGPIPLPRHRPRYFAMAETGVPTPRPRPASATAGAPVTNDGPLGWIRNIFQPQQP
jgi:hypothetical protein